MNIPVPTICEFLLSVLFKPMQILQYFAITVWVYEGSFIFACLMLVFTFGIMILNFNFAQKSMRKINQMSKTDLSVKVHRR